MTVLCRECDFVCGETKKLPPFKWRCLKSPMALEAPRDILFVDPDYRPNAPYSLCSNINKDGDCPDFVPRRETPKGDV
jgi:hypothetical protein